MVTGLWPSEADGPRAVPASQRFALATVLEGSNVFVLSTRCDRGPVAIRCEGLKTIDEFVNCTVAMRYAYKSGSLCHSCSMSRMMRAQSNVTLPAGKRFSSSK